VIDLRSDTLTQPTPGMREAMAQAVVGDEQRGEDPTVLELEERAAELLGQERAIFLPTATMANQIALRALTEPGDEAVGHTQAHIFRMEGGGPAAHSGLSMRMLEGERGIFDAAALREAVNPDVPHRSRTRIVCVENTHNGGGGKVWPLETLGEVTATARELGLSAHLDGARLLNAATALGVSPARIGGMFDTVTLCLSKGLGCPLGAVLACSATLAKRAWRLKFLFGGAMRQAGVVAAAGVYAFEHHVERLANDHANARALASGFAAAGLPVDAGAVESNFLQIDCNGLALSREDVIATLEREGVRVSIAAPPGVLRAVTHLEIGADDVLTAVEAARRAFAPVAG
jgi:threonine aldolase